MKFKLFLISLVTISIVHAQKPKSYTSGEIQLMLKKLTVCGTVLYVAAHPDDENTRLITYLANEKLVETGYLSATRGDGGQNLIGKELWQDLGLIRTQELLQARQIDGGKQFFTRANDFGFSKHPDETFDIWGEKEILADFIQVYRQFKPDIVITRFNLTPGTTHGHHTASAILAKRAFELAADPSVYPEQVKKWGTWQPSKLYWNTSWFFFQNNGQKMDTTGTVRIDVGGFNPWLGNSYPEIAAESRTMHKSQGFGSSGVRGEEIEYLVPWAGENTKKLFDGINLSWDRVPDGKPIGELLQRADDEYFPSNPEKTLNYLSEARTLLVKLENTFWRERKLKELDEVILAISGIYLEVNSKDFRYSLGDTMKVSIEAIARNIQGVSLQEITFEPWGIKAEWNSTLLQNKRLIADYRFPVTTDIPLTQPYWLQEPASLGRYTVSNSDWIGLAERQPEVYARFILDMGGYKIESVQPIVFKRTDPVEGEVFRPVVISPQVTGKVSNEYLMYTTLEKKKVEITLQSIAENISGILSLSLPEGWSYDKKTIPFSLEKRGMEKKINFEIWPEKKAENGSVTFYLEINEDKNPLTYSTEIRYSHIPTQTYFSDTKVELRRIETKGQDLKVGYIAGAGDLIAERLPDIGIKISTLTPDDLSSINLSSFDAVILGIRAYNTQPDLVTNQAILHEYVKNGGVLVVQYNTTSGLLTKSLAPYPLTIGRDRVTNERAEVTLLEPDHPIWNFPNRISANDFEGWIQERGLYFAKDWSSEFKPMVRMNDPGEDPLEGGLMVAQYGQGYYVYSGLSWFRQLPAGVPGAYRMLVNILSLGKTNKK